MTIKITNEVFNNATFFEAIKKINDFEDFSPKDAYRLHCVTKELALKAIDFNSVRMKLLEKYGKKNEEKGVYQFDSDNAKKFEKDFAELLNVEIEIDQSKVNYPPELKLSPAQIDTIEPFFDFSTFQ